LSTRQSTRRVRQRREITSSLLLEVRQPSVLQQPEHQPSVPQQPEPQPSVAQRQVPGSSFLFLAASGQSQCQQGSDQQRFFHGYPSGENEK